MLVNELVARSSLLDEDEEHSIPLVHPVIDLSKMLLHLQLVILQLLPKKLACFPSSGGRVSTRPANNLDQDTTMAFSIIHVAATPLRTTLGYGSNLRIASQGCLGRIWLAGRLLEVLKVAYDCIDDMLRFWESIPMQVNL